MLLQVRHFRNYNFFEKSDSDYEEHPSFLELLCAGDGSIADVCFN